MPGPIVGITMGDAAGVGPEIIAKALAWREVYELCRPLVVGDAGRLREAAGVAGSRLRVSALSEPEQAAFRLGEIDCVDLHLIPDDLPFGKLAPAAARSGAQPATSPPA